MSLILVYNCPPQLKGQRLIEALKLGFADKSIGIAPTDVTVAFSDDRGWDPQSPTVIVATLLFVTDTTPSVRTTLAAGLAEMYGEVAFKSNLQNRFTVAVLHHADMVVMRRTFSK